MRLESRLLLSAGAFVAVAVPVALLAYAATHGWPPLHRVDSSAADSLHRWAEDTPAVVTAMQGVSNVLDPWLLRAVSLGIVVLLVVRRQRRLAAWFATTIVAAGVLGITLKSVVSRARPHLPDPVAHAGGYSFPSGHALTSFVFFVVVVLLVLPLVPKRFRPLLWCSAGALIALVGFARVTLGVHYVSDVVAAWILGAGLIAITTTAFETWRRDRGERTPDVLAAGVDPRGTREAVGQVGGHGR